MSPSYIRKVLSQDKSFSVNVHKVVYNLSSYDTSYTYLLVDRGSNGGIASEDVRVIEKLNCSVYVQGIDNHQLENIPIVTAAGFTKSQRGDIIVILHQYAYVGKGTSIHSSPQIESYKNIVDDRAIKAGGKQLIKTVDNYVIPLNVKNALPRMQLRPYSDKEWNDLPHVVLTSELT